MFSNHVSGGRPALLVPCNVVKESPPSGLHCFPNKQHSKGQLTVKGGVGGGTLRFLTELKHTCPCDQALNGVALRTWRQSPAHCRPRS
jgi:hypothetical protein